MVSTGSVAVVSKRLVIKMRDIVICDRRLGTCVLDLVVVFVPKPSDTPTAIAKAVLVPIKVNLMSVSSVGV